MMKTGEPSKNIGLIKFAAALLTLLIFGCNKNDISDLNNKQSEAKREPQWHPSISLSDDKNGSPETLGKSIASSGDTIHVLYSDFSYENRGDLFYKRSTDGGTNWQPMKKINNSKGGFGSPSIYCSGKNLGIIWIEGNDNDWYKSQVFLKRSTDGGTTWEKDVSLTDKNKRASFPVIAIQNDNFYLVWSDDKIIDFWKGNIHRRPKLKISRDAGQNWNNEVSIINSVKSSSYNIATSGDNVYLTWLDNDTKELKFKSSNNKGDIWGEEKFLLGTKDFFHVPDISASGSNVFILSNSYIRSSDYGSTWSAGTKLFDGDSYFFHCISSSENYVNVLWRDIGKYGENLTINHRRSTDYGLTWSDTFPLPEIEGTSDAPNITSSGNEIHTIWIDQHLKYSEILYRRFSSREIVKKSDEKFPDTVKFANDAEKIIHDATNGEFNSVSGTFMNTDCNEKVEYGFLLIDLNDDGNPEVFQTVSGTQMCYGKYGCETTAFFKNEKGEWNISNSWIGCFEIKILPSVNNSYHDIQLSSGWDDNLPVWRWNGKLYELFAKENYDRTDDHSNKGEENEGNDQISGNSIEATNQVRSWIESLGKRDFQAAYNLMTPSLSKSYAIFTSTNRYGGIVKTNIHSVETVSSSGCNYVVVASYDSYDPSNRDGKFTERFSVNNCSGDWQITNIKNISVEYYR